MKADFWEDEDIEEFLRAAKGIRYILKTRAHTFLLDTDVASYIFGEKSDAARYEPLLAGAVAVISFVTLAEMLYGALKHNWSDRRIQTLERHFAEKYTILPYSEAVAKTWARLVASCGLQGLTVGDNATPGRNRNSHVDWRSSATISSTMRAYTQS